jgi:D-mannonate dehydratase
VLERHRAKVEGFGPPLDMVQRPLGSHPIERSQSPGILLAGPGRDRQIDSICKLVRILARAGIPAAKYNMNLIGIPRIGSASGRGGSRNSTRRHDTRGDRRRTKSRRFSTCTWGALGAAREHGCVSSNEGRCRGRRA